MRMVNMSAEVINQLTSLDDVCGCVNQDLHELDMVK